MLLSDYMQKLNCKDSNEVRVEGLGNSGSAVLVPRGCAPSHRTAAAGFPWNYHFLAKAKYSMQHIPPGVYNEN